MTPGPSEVHPEILALLARPQLLHYGAEWGSFYRETCESLKPLFGTDGQPMLLFGSGSLAMELGIANALKPGDEVVNVVTGYFGRRWEEMLTLRRLRCHSISAELGKTVPPEEVKKSFKEHPGAKAVVAVHMDTSSGVASPIDQYAEIAQKYGAIVIIDAICSFGGAPIEMDKWGLDFCAGYPSKCLSSISGMTPFAVSKRLWEIAESGGHEAGWYINLKTIRGFVEDWGTWGHPYPTTIAVQPVVALREAMRILGDEGLQNWFQRHRSAGSAMRAAARALGLKTLANEDVAAPMVSPILVGNGQDKKVQSILLEHHNIEVGGGLVAPMIRIGHMGRSAHPQFVLVTVSALEATLRELGRPIRNGVGLSAAQEYL
jgi:alanine-glyoxylate transaminase/serine-glyoxylate transaminase/serine-pyruvate transaminase